MYDPCSKVSGMSIPARTGSICDLWPPLPDPWTADYSLGASGRAHILRCGTEFANACFWTHLPGSETQQPLDLHFYLPKATVFSKQNIISSIVRPCVSLLALAMFSTHESSALCSVLSCGSRVLVWSCQQFALAGWILLFWKSLPLPPFRYLFIFRLEQDSLLNF